MAKAPAGAPVLRGQAQVQVQNVKYVTKVSLSAMAEEVRQFRIAAVELTPEAITGIQEAELITATFEYRPLTSMGGGLTFAVDYPPTGRSPVSKEEMMTMRLVLSRTNEGCKFSLDPVELNRIRNGNGGNYGRLYVGIECPDSRPDDASMALGELWCRYTVRTPMGSSFH